MLRRGIVWALALAGPLAATSARAPGQEATPAAAETSQDLRFIRGLRERGYYDLALEYIEGLLKDPATPADLKPVLNYEVGRGLLDEATALADLERRHALLEQARLKLDGFVKSFPKHSLTPEALVQLARLYVERGHTSMLQADEAKAPADKQARLAAARSAFEEARKAYAAAEPSIQAAYDAFPKFIPDEDPRREARDRAHTALMEDQLQKAIVDYEEAQTHPAGSPQRTELLDRAIAQFNDLHDRYRTQVSGLYARMLQGKSYEEKGELGPAMGIYNELMEHPEPRLRDLQRKVGYYRIIVLGKRKEHALAADEAVRWLSANPNHHSTEDGLGVQLELAKNLVAQFPGATDQEREQATRQVVERLSQVVRYYSPHKPEALKLLQEYQPKAARKVNQIGNFSFDDAMAQADTAISTHDWGLAVDLLNQAVRRAQQSREVDKVNRARYFLAYCYYMDGRYYSAYAMADHLSRRYPEGGLSPKAAEIGIASLTMAYNTFTKVDRLSDLDRLVELAEYTAKTWPDTEQADGARFSLGEITMGRGQYAESAGWFEGVRPDSSRRLDAQVKAGDAHWREAQRLRDDDKTTEADAEANKALELIASALKARDEANVAVTDPARITNANALAEIHRVNGKPEEAIKLLEPISQALSSSSASAEVVPLYSASLSILVRAHLAVGQPEKAIATMKVLESVSPTKAALTQLYFELSRALKAEMDALEKKGDTGNLKRTKDAYKAFLQALADSQAGQNYTSLQWAGESMLSLNMPKEAESVFRRVLDLAGKDRGFLGDREASARLLHTRLRLGAALRQQGKFDAARDLIQPLVDENPRLLDPMMEKGYLLEDQARSENSRGAWEASLAYWKNLALRLRQARKLPPEYFESWYHVAIGFGGLAEAEKNPKFKTEAIGTLKGIMTLNPTVGGPEMKAKYEELIKRLGG
jgi:outer membrane protein assembly factor BamD (BamD/ComL family)